jgi:aspartate racemase
MRGRDAAGDKRSRLVRSRPSGRPAIGILGGMGPEATGYFFDLIIKNTVAAKDQDHLPVLVWSGPGVPPRTDAILGTGPSPLPALLAGVSRLERAGAGLIAMPCITAHFWAREVAAAARVPFIDLVRETAGHARKAFPRLRTAGLLASTGTVRSGLFQAAFERKGISLLAPEPREQEAVMEAIFGPRGIKAGFTAGPARSAVLRIARRLIDRGAQAVVAGCTEIPLVLRAADLPVPLLEPMLIGARACIRRAGGRLRPPAQGSGPARRG